MEKNFKYTLIHKDKHCNARLGKLKIFDYEVETPIFMPVGTQATVKFLSPEDLKNINAGIILANT